MDFHATVHLQAHLLTLKHTPLVWILNHGLDMYPTHTVHIQAQLFLSTESEQLRYIFTFFNP